MAGIDRNLGMELVRVTEAAALSAAPHMGRGDGKAGDGAAVRAMRALLGTVRMAGTVVIGEGEKDDAPMLWNGETVGSGEPPALDLAVDPVEGTRLLALGRPNAIAVIAAAPAGTLWTPGDSFYMDKLVAPAAARGAVDISAPPARNLAAVAEALDRPVHELTVFVLDKPRHEALIREIREAGARVSLHTDGDVMGALLAAYPDTGVDLLMGIGGTPEGVIAAAAVKALGGEMQGRRAPQLDEERERLSRSVPASELDRVLHLADLVQGEDAFFAATAITDSPFLEGVRYRSGLGVTTESLVIRARSGSIRHIRGVHRLDAEHIFGGGNSREEFARVMDVVAD
ncbi:MAG: class II fructose-bisphosphatase [Gemmatimonadales bacterium]|nr:MAG: class II fructose-bisphosphatase [Gemmatimonadales bacterium]